MTAPENFAAWLANHQHIDRKYGHVYKYHSRSDAHSIALCSFIMADLLLKCDVMRQQARVGRIGYGINIRHRWPNGKQKTIDLAVGILGKSRPSENGTKGIQRAEKLRDVLISLEAKTVMTEHKKSQPRVFDELSSSHEIVHQGSPSAIAAGITVVNISSTFASPLRQISRAILHMTNHRQPQVAESMVNHLRGLPIREEIGRVGFDAYCTLVIDCDNVNTARLWTAPPAPQPGDRDHYGSFLDRISRFYRERFAVLP